MNLIAAITLAITIAWLQYNAISGALVNTRMGQVQSEVTHLDAVATGKPSSGGERQFLFKNRIGRSHLNSAEVIKLYLDYNEDPARVILTSIPPGESTTTARPSLGQIPRPAMVSHRDKSLVV